MQLQGEYLALMSWLVVSLTVLIMCYPPPCSFICFYLHISLINSVYFVQMIVFWDAFLVVHGVLFFSPTLLRTVLEYSSCCVQVSLSTILTPALLPTL